jgi:hypothetical protein
LQRRAWLHHGHHSFIGFHPIANVKRHAFFIVWARNPQDLAGDRRRDRVDVTSIGLCLVVNRDLRRTFRDAGKINEDRSRPRQPVNSSAPMMTKKPNAAHLARDAKEAR